MCIVALVERPFHGSGFVYILDATCTIHGHNKSSSLPGLRLSSQSMLALMSPETYQVSVLHVPSRAFLLGSIRAAVDFDSSPPTLHQFCTTGYDDGTRITVSVDLRFACYHRSNWHVRKACGWRNNSSRERGDGVACA